MNEIAKSLEDITNEAKTIYNRMEKDYARWGELMLEAKKLVPHGQWTGYLETNFPDWGARQSRRYMQLAKEPEKTLIDVTHKRTPESVLMPPVVREKPTQSQPIISPSEYQLDKANRQYLTDFKQRSMVMIMHLREFLTINEPVGRDLNEAINNIDKVDSQADLEALREMQHQCERLTVRAMTLAERIVEALESKEKVI